MTAANEVLVAALRDMLRDEFKMADNRDMAVAQAVQELYLQQFPHMRILIDQPDLAGIIAKVRTPAPCAPPLMFQDHRWSDDEIDALLAAPRAPMILRMDPSAETFANAARYLVLRDVADDLLGAAGVPCIAMPDGPDHGNYISGVDADRMIDAYIAKAEA